MTRPVEPDSDAPADPGPSSAAPWLQELPRALRSLSAQEVQKWLAANRELVQGLLETEVRDPRFRDLIDPSRIKVDPGTDPETFDWEAAEVTGLEETVNAMAAEVPAAIEKMVAAFEGDPGADPLTAYRLLLRAVKQLIEDDPEGSKAGSLRAMLADAERAADATTESGPSAVTPFETLATLAGMRGDFILKEAIREGADPKLLAHLGPGSDLAKAESAIWQTPTAAITPPASAIGLGRMEVRLRGLRHETQKALVADALAETPGEAIPRRRAQARSKRPADGEGSESESAPDSTKRSLRRAPDETSAVEEVALAHLEWERLADARDRGRLAEREFLLLEAARDGLPTADVARQLHISPDAARQELRRARRVARVILGR
ncbi:MAG: hypothetical protein M0027_04065 [Candidatus Dormibacteraeota bacterium]|nr:hypothetical protein [Candidatus Dormibacteraeota bacterium]